MQKDYQLFDILFTCIQGWIRYQRLTFLQGNCIRFLWILDTYRFMDFEDLALISNKNKEHDKAEKEGPSWWP